MVSWIPNSCVNIQCCLGKVIDELGAYSVSIMIGTRKKRIAFLVEKDKIDDFMASKYFIKSAMIEKTVLRSGRVWFSFDLIQLIIKLREGGFC